MIASFLAGAARGSWRAPAGLVLSCVALLWFAVNSTVEGQVLVVVSAGHGFTGADIAGVIALALGAFRLVAPLLPLHHAPRGDDTRPPSTT